MILRTFMVLLGAVCMLGQVSIAQDRPVRFVIASFEVDGSNEDLARRLRSDFESQLFDVTDQCREFLEFIPDAREEALEYLVGVRTRYRDEYGVQGERLAIPKQGNYVLLVRVSNDNFGVIMNIGIFRKEAGSLTYVSQGRAETSTALASLYERGNRQNFIHSAIEDAFSVGRLSTWIGATQLSEAKDCFSTPRRPTDPTKPVSPIDNTDFYPYKTESGDFLVQIDRITQVGGNIKIEYRLFSQKNETIYVYVYSGDYTPTYQSKLNLQGDIFFSSAAEIGTKRTTGRGYTGENVSGKAWIKGEIEFANIPPQKELDLLQISFSSNSGGSMNNLILRNLPVLGSN